MSHKDMCIEWVEDHKLDDDGWWIIDDDGTPVGESFATEEDRDLEIWKLACGLSWSSLGVIERQD